MFGSSTRTVASNGRTVARFDSNRRCNWRPMATALAAAGCSIASTVRRSQRPPMLAVAARACAPLQRQRSHVAAGSLLAPKRRRRAAACRQRVCAVAESIAGPGSSSGPPPPGNPAAAKSSGSLQQVLAGTWAWLCSIKPPKSLWRTFAAFVLGGQALVRILQGEVQLASLPGPRPAVRSSILLTAAWQLRTSAVETVAVTGRSAMLPSLLPPSRQDTLAQHDRAAGPGGPPLAGRLPAHCRLCRHGLHHPVHPVSRLPWPHRWFTKKHR
jgi:hypothetical protein